jgi:hypothetical protein
MTNKVIIHSNWIYLGLALMSWFMIFTHLIDGDDNDDDDDRRPASFMIRDMVCTYSRFTMTHFMVLLLSSRASLLYS